VLVGHSYGGAVITEAGTHPNVAALVYIAAFAPDQGESVNTLIADPPPGAPVPPILPPNNGFLFLDREKFHASFAADVPAAQVPEARNEISSHHSQRIQIRTMKDGKRNTSLASKISSTASTTCWARPPS
jgi:pimeloyl-ACP methyl ester carboxylesterase